METKQRFVTVHKEGINSEELDRKRFELYFYHTIFEKTKNINSLSEREKEIFIDFHINKLSIRDISQKISRSYVSTKHMLKNSELFIKCRFREIFQLEEDLNKRNEELLKINKSLYQKNITFEFRSKMYSSLYDELKLLKKQIKKSQIISKRIYIDNINDPFFEKKIIDVCSVGDYDFITTRTYLRLLDSHNVQTVNDLFKLNDEELLSIKGFGKGCLSEIHEFFDFYGIDFKTKAFVKKPL